MVQGATPDVELDGISPDEAFAVLGNEIRLGIVRALWEADAAHEYDDVDDAADSIPFSELRRRVDVDDNGKFNYHLSKLTPHFVRGTDDGYRLSGAGKQIARTVIAVSGPDDVDFSADLELDCPLCGAPVSAAYEDQWIRVRCSGCDGLFGDEAPRGMVFLSNYPPAGLADRAVEEVIATGFYRCMLDITYMMHGICRACSGRISGSVSVCEGHDPGPRGRCRACGTTFPAWAEQRCETCGFAKRLPVESFVMGLTPVIGFLDDQGVDILAPSLHEVVDLLRTRFDTAFTDDPLRVSVTIEGESESLTVTLDDDVDVLGVERSALAD